MIVIAVLTFDIHMREELKRKASRKIGINSGRRSETKPDEDLKRKARPDRGTPKIIYSDYNL